MGLIEDTWFCQFSFLLNTYTVLNWNCFFFVSQMFSASHVLCILQCKISSLVNRSCKTVSVVVVSESHPKVHGSNYHYSLP